MRHWFYVDVCALARFGRGVGGWAHEWQATGCWCANDCLVECENDCLPACWLPDEKQQASKNHCRVWPSSCVNPADASSNIPKGAQTADVQNKWADTHKTHKPVVQPPP